MPYNFKTGHDKKTIGERGEGLCGSHIVQNPAEQKLGIVNEEIR